LNQEYRYKIRELRRQSTETENLLWSLLRSRKLRRYKFRRQHAIGQFIADFCCLEKRLIIELDGEIHRSQATEDAKRTALLEENGYRVLRFWNSEVKKKSEEVLQQILTALDAIPGRVTSRRSVLYSWTAPLHIQGRGDGGEGV
jgi:very-short-patch-repair endonuclease